MSNLQVLFSFSIAMFFYFSIKSFHSLVSFLGLSLNVSYHTELSLKFFGLQFLCLSGTCFNVFDD